MAQSKEAVLLEKIAAHVGDLAARASQRDTLLKKAEHMRGVLEKSAEAMYDAASKITTLEQAVEKLAAENEALTKVFAAREKAERSTKLAKEMLSRGMIKQADFDTKVDSLMSLSDDAFEVLSQTVDETPAASAGYRQNALSKVSYLLDDDSASASEKPEFSEAITERARRL